MNKQGELRQQVSQNISVDFCYLKYITIIELSSHFLDVHFLPTLNFIFYFIFYFLRYCLTPLLPFHFHTTAFVSLSSLYSPNYLVFTLDDISYLLLQNKIAYNLAA